MSDYEETDALRELRLRIIRGDLLPGQKLHQELLAGELGVSRIPVRDALQALAAEGLVQFKGGRSGAIVKEMTVTDLEELYELRGAIEPMASRLGTPNMGRADLLQMEEYYGLMKSTDDGAAWLETNTSFHALLYRRSNRSRMIELIELLRKQTDRYLHLHLAVIGNTEHLQEEHKLIMEAAQRGDAAAVESFTRAHLSTSHDFILRYLLELGAVRDGGAVMPEGSAVKNDRR